MRSLLLCFLLLVSCSSSEPSPEAEEAASIENTDNCLANSELARQWGECNVKHTIYGGRSGIGNCHRKFGRDPKSADTTILKIRLLPTGKVRDVKAEEAGPRNKSLENCLSQVIAKLQFAAPPKGVKPVIYVPFQQ